MSLPHSLSFFFMNNQQFLMGFKLGEFPGQSRIGNHSFFRLSITSLLGWQGTPSYMKFFILCNSMKKDKVICQHLLLSLPVHHHIIGQRVEASPPNLPAVTSPGHDNDQVLDSGDGELALVPADGFWASSPSQFWS
jgi:hypothetical protein